MDDSKCIYEELDLVLYNRVDYTKVNSEMTDLERRFVHGLIRNFKPKKLLEIGVSTGGGSVNLLNAISDDKLATLTSVDRSIKYYRNNEINIGSDVATLFPKLPCAKWKLLIGVDISEVIEDFEEFFDFAIIDTAHMHPVESLNFLCVLPFLRDGAVVVFHDISLFYFSECKHTQLATRILISALSGEKVFPAQKSALYISETEPVHNICAIIITKELRRYIYNLFIALSIPWELYPVDDIANIRKFLYKYYCKENLVLFDEAEGANLAYKISGGATHSIAKLSSVLKKLSKASIFYGAGQNMRLLLRLYSLCEIEFNYPIWDKNAAKVNQIKKYPVTFPDLDTHVTGITAIITVTDNAVATLLNKQLEELGYTCICGFEELFSDLQTTNYLDVGI